MFLKNKQYLKFCAYGFLKNLRFYEAFLLLFFLENGISYSKIGVLYAFREIIITVFEIPSGLLADTYGRKNALLLSFVSYICSFVLFYFSTDFYLLLAAMFLFGIGDAFRSGTHKGMIMDYLKLNNWQDYKIDYYGHTRSWSQMGSAISALFAGFLVLYSGNYRAIFLFSVIPYLLNFINILSYPKELNFSKVNTKSEPIKKVFNNFLEMMKRPKVIEIINSSALYSSFLKAVKDYIQPIMLQIAMSIPILISIEPKKKNGVLIGLLYFCIFILTSFASRNAFKLNRIKVKNIAKSTLLFGLIIGVFCGVFIHYQFWIISFVLFVIIYLVENGRKPILTGYLSNNVPNDILTSVLSAQNFYRTIITSILALLFGVLADNYSLGTAFILISSLLAITVLVISMINSKLKTKYD